MSTSVAPGWYGDSAAGTAPGRQRYWNGSVWTDKTHDPPAPAPALGCSTASPSAASTTSLPLGATIGIAAGCALAIGILAYLRRHAVNEYEAWLTYLVLPTVALVTVGAVVRRARRWDLVARNGFVAIVVNSVGGALLTTIAPYTAPKEVGLLSGPRFIGVVNDVGWYRYVLAILLLTALVGACAGAAIHWTDPAARFRAAAGGATAALIVLPTAALDGINYGDSPLHHAIPMLLWLVIASSLMMVAAHPGPPYAEDASLSPHAPWAAVPTGSAGDSQTRPPARPPAPPYVLASMGSRLGARIIDAILLTLFDVIVVVLLIAGIASGSNGGTSAALLGIAVVLVIMFLWEPLFLANSGATPGKKLVGICVVREDTGAPIGASKAWGRTLLPIVWIWIPFVNLILTLAAILTAFGDSKRRTWMDKAVGTVVVRRASVRTATEAARAHVPASASAGSALPATPPVAPWPATPVPPAALSVGSSPVIDEVPGIVSAPVVAPAEPPAPAASAPRILEDDFDSSATLHAADISRFARRSSFTLTFSTGQSVQMTSGRLIVGRSPQVITDEPDVQTVSIDDPDRLTSRTHLLFTVHDGKLTAEDAYSANGSAMITPNGAQTPMVAGSPIAAVDGCRVLFGGCHVSISTP